MKYVNNIVDNKFENVYNNVKNIKKCTMYLSFNLKIFYNKYQ